MNKEIKKEFVEYFENKLIDQDTNSGWQMDHDFIRDIASRTKRKDHIFDVGMEETENIFLCFLDYLKENLSTIKEPEEKTCTGCKWLYAKYEYKCGLCIKYSLFEEDIDDIETMKKQND